MTPWPARSGPPAGSAPVNVAERLLVVRGHDEQVLAPRARGDRLEAELADAPQPVEPLRRDLLRDAGDPDRALRPGGAVVQPVDQVPGHRPPVRQLAHAGRPQPGHVARVAARRLVEQPGQVDRPAERRPAHAGRALSRPHRAVPDGPRRAGLELELQHAGHVHAGGIHGESAAERALVQALPVPHRPPARAEGPDPHGRRAQHQVRAERPDPRPVLVEGHRGVSSRLRD